MSDSKATSLPLTPTDLISDWREAAKLRRNMADEAYRKECAGGGPIQTQRESHNTGYAEALENCADLLERLVAEQSASPKADCHLCRGAGAYFNREQTLFEIEEARAVFATQSQRLGQCIASARHQIEAHGATVQASDDVRAKALALMNRSQDCFSKAMRSQGFEEHIAYRETAENFMADLRSLLEGRGDGD